MNPELDMLFPRLYSRMHAQAYGEWVRLDTVPGQLVTVSAETEDGDKVAEQNLMVQPEYNSMTGAIYYPEKQVYKPTMAQNLAYFFNYQLNHMYMRYFMWNFAGRQNDLLNQHGELDAGNWISGIGFIDNARLGDQSLLPDDLGKGNAGHNVYFMLPLILGLIGLVWQSFAGRRGIEQFWVVFFLFFMTGIAIVVDPGSGARARLCLRRLLLCLRHLDRHGCRRPMAASCHGPQATRQERIVVVWRGGMCARSRGASADGVADLGRP